MTLRNFMLALSTIFALVFITPNRVAADIKQAFQNAITAVEKRDYRLLGSILEEHPQLLRYTAEQGDSLFNEFSNVVYEDFEPPLGNYADLAAIGILLDHGADPHMSNGLIASLLVEANRFYGDTDAYPVNSGRCTDNRTAYFPLINRLIEAGASLGPMHKEFRGVRVSEAFFYQLQLCFKPFVSGSDSERPSNVVARRVSAATKRQEKDLLFNSSASGVLDTACLMALYDW